MNVAESGSNGDFLRDGRKFLNTCTHPRSFSLLTPLLSTPFSTPPRRNAKHGVVSPLARATDPFNVLHVSSISTGTSTARPDTSPSSTTPNRRSDLQLLGGREVRHHKRLLETRENEAFPEDGQPKHLPKPRASEAEQLTVRINDHCGTTTQNRRSCGTHSPAASKLVSITRTISDCLDDFLTTRNRAPDRHGIPWQSGTAMALHGTLVNTLACQGLNPSCSLGKDAYSGRLSTSSKEKRVE